MTEFTTPEVLIVIGTIFISIVYIVCKSNGHISITVDLSKGKLTIRRKKG
jgi:hypothetical protein